MKRHNSLGAVLTALCLTSALLGGCGEIKVRAGTPVPTSLIESQLELGKSTEKDIRMVLGEPLGVGREFLPFQNQPRTIMSYYFEEGQFSLSGGGDSRRVFVWIFLNNEHYDGYLWVSSLPADHAP